jgi:hypothetical protein
MPLTLKVSEERLNSLPFEVYRKSGQDPDSQARFIAHFAIDEESGDYLTKEQALAKMDEMTLGEVSRTVEELRSLADETAAPKA